ncbi:hypothetical protein CK503_13675 [Aliifodinibius salipaludis]|uniref:Bacteriocin n=2 Tax=Fodinibius salipaludis TaxID=2032627 RepID=A0A2A2G5Q4_9BACT|nr:hypothetical protein CK503_13675 [Aliifodinibius salipaludis]
MNTLSKQQMTQLSGGDMWDFVDGGCAVFAVGTVLSGGAAAANPVGGTIAAGCAARQAYKAFS